MKKIISIAIILVSVTGILLLISRLLGPGSYPTGKFYEINTNESDLILKIENFKVSNPKFIVPENFGLTDGRKNTEDYWHHFYFYLEDTNEILHTWVRGENDKITTFALIGVNRGPKIGNWFDIVADLNRKEKNFYIKQFENLILTKVQNE